MQRPSTSIIYYTANFNNEYFAENICRQIINAAGKRMPIISVSQKPIEFGDNICVGNIGQSHLNIYRQILIGAKAAKTKYVFTCDDDVLYTPWHFTSFLPPEDTFAYNINRWRIYTWVDPPVFSYTARPVGSQMVAPRQLLVDVLQKRFEKYPDEASIPDLKYFCEPGRRDHLLGMPRPKMTTFKSLGAPNVVFTTTESMGYHYFKKNETKKSHGKVKKDTLPYWGSAKKVMKYYAK
jgi:hypothetical protein